MLKGKWAGLITISVNVTQSTATLPYGEYNVYFTLTSAGTEAAEPTLDRPDTSVSLELERGGSGGDAMFTESTAIS